MDDPESGPKPRESQAPERLSPSTKYWFWTSVVLEIGLEPIWPKRGSYHPRSRSGRPSTKIVLSMDQIVWPGSATTRSTRHTGLAWPGSRGPARHDRGPPCRWPGPGPGDRGRIADPGRGPARRRPSNDRRRAASRTPADRRRAGRAIIGRMSADLRPGLAGIPPESLAAWFAERGHASFRARQLNDALWAGGATAAASIGTLPAALRSEIDAAFSLDTVADTELRLADDGRTEKALHRLADGALIEG